MIGYGVQPCWRPRCAICPGNGRRSRPLLAETFTDPETHAGTCYSAAGWQAVGYSRSEAKHYGSVPAKCAPEKAGQGAGTSAGEALRGRTAHGAASGYGRSRCKTAELCSLYEVSRHARRRRQARRYLIGAVLTLIALGLLRGAVHLSTIVRTAQKLTQAAQTTAPAAQERNEVSQRAWLRCLSRSPDRIDLDLTADPLVAKPHRTTAAHAGGRRKSFSIGPDVALVDTEEGTPVALAANVEERP